MMDQWCFHATAIKPAIPREGVLNGTGPVTKNQESSLNQYIKIMTLTMVIKIMILPNVFYTAGGYVEYLIIVLFLKKEVAESKIVLKIS